MIKLSPTQIEVLVHMEKGHKLHTSGLEAPWLDLAQFPVRITTWSALWDRKYIKRDDSENTTDCRRDYVITDQGVEALYLLGVLAQLPLEGPE